MILSLIRKYGLPLSPILEYAINEKKEEYTDTTTSDVVVPVIEEHINDVVEQIADSSTEEIESEDEKPEDGEEEIEIFDEESPWKRKAITNYTIKNLRVQIYDGGKRVYESPSVKEVQQYCKDQIETIWEETLRFENPQTYYVDLSQKLWDLKQGLMEEHGKKSR